MQADLGGGLRNIPLVLFELPLEIGDLESPLRLTKIGFAEERVPCPVPRHSGQARRAGWTCIVTHFLGEIGGRNFIAPAHDERAFERVAQLADVARPIVALHERHRLRAQASPPAMARRRVARETPR